MVPESEQAPNPELDGITDIFAVVPDQTSATEKQTNTPFPTSVLTNTEHEDPSKSTSSLPTRSGSAERASEARKHPFPYFGRTYTLWEIVYFHRV